MPFNRFAIYYTPPPGPLAEFGKEWLGWDPATGMQVQHPQIDDLPVPLHELTEQPGKYGLHATMKPPFRLAPGQGDAALQACFAAFCKAGAPVTLDGLEIALLGRFLALIPSGNQAALNALAAETVRGFDRFRAPLTKTELARRRANGLDAEHEALLHEWGYPYVMQAFRFHITLTSKLPKARARQVHEILTPLLSPLIPSCFTIDALSLMGEDDQGRFHLIERRQLEG